MPPISGDVFGAILCTSLAHFLSGVLICLDYVHLACAATQVAGDRVTDFVVSWIVVLLQEGVSGHQHAGRAVAALEAVLLEESVLQWMQFAVLFESFDGQDRASIGLDSECRARLDRFSIEHDCTRAAVTRITADVRAGQAQVFAQEVDQ